MGREDPSVYFLLTVMREDKRGRFEVSSVDSPAGNTLSDNAASPNSSPSNSLGRGSRFTTSLIQPSANSNLSQSQPQPVPAPQNVAGDDRFETIMRQNEQMKQMLGEIMMGLNKPVKAADSELSAASRVSVDAAAHPAGFPEMGQPMNPYDSQVLAILQENEMLRKENEQLRVAVVALESRLQQSNL
ncbi:hypothetical protein HDU67_004171 [Dinochytrium kinnereticum]|nr:hypothetical protein HDU67_004171 [Dinochytrium kinnereticum]